MNKHRDHHHPPIPPVDSRLETPVGDETRGLVLPRKPRKAKVIVVSALAAVLVIGVILYALADRYLIEHVKIKNADEYQNSFLVSADSEDTAESSGTSVADETASGASEGVTSSTTQTASTVSSAVIADEWSYQGSGIEVTITQKTRGSGSSQVVYFVADVRLNVATSLKAAFAKNRFGQNITENTSAIAEDNNAVFAINGDYYGFRDDGIIIRNGVLYRNEPARTGLAIYKDGSMKIYDETATDGETLVKQGVWQTLSFGPALLTNGAIPSGLEQQEVDTNFGNHSIQGNQPRTGIGLIDENHFVFIVVDGRKSGYSVGLGLTKFAELFQSYGCTQAYNLDGGGSSTMYFNGRVVNNPLGRNQERGVSDILYLG